MASPSMQAASNTPDRLGPYDQSGVLTIGAATNCVVLTPTITANAYSTGNLLGTKLTITTASRLTAGTGDIVSVTLIDQAKQSIAVDVLFWNADPSGTTFTDRSALDIADADMLKLIGGVQIATTDYYAFSDNSMACKTNIGLPFGPLASGTSIYCCIVARGTATYAATSDIQLTVGIRWD